MEEAGRQAGTEGGRDPAVRSLCPVPWGHRHGCPGHAEDYPCRPAVSPTGWGTGEFALICRLTPAMGKQRL